jgi:hypothetical protein
LRNKFHHTATGAVLTLVGLFASGCTGTIHWSENIGGADTLSVDARQRLLMVGTRVAQTKHGIESKPVRCTEPSPDALVAMQAALSGSASVSNVSGVSAAGAIAARSSEAAASIGYRDSSIQMLRDAYFRLCEAYMNGVLTQMEYEHMVTNADTYLAVASAIQIIGANPTAPVVAISAGGGTTTVITPAVVAPKTSQNAVPEPNEPAVRETVGAASGGGGSGNAGNQAVTETAADKKRKAQLIREIVDHYLSYREDLRRATEPDLRKDRIEQKSGPPIPVGPTGVPPMVRVPVVPVAAE